MVDLNPVEASVAAAANAIVAAGTAGATITQGQPLYRATDGDLELADTDTSAATAAVVGISLNAASDGQPVDYIISGTLTVGAASVLVGTVYVLSGNAGLIAPTTDLATGDYTCVLGVGLTASTIKISINAGGVAVPA